MIILLSLLMSPYENEQVEMKFSSKLQNHITKICFASYD